MNLNWVVDTWNTATVVQVVTPPPHQVLYYQRVKID